MKTDPTGPRPTLVWPGTVQVPANPPALVYLDRNHWVRLARAGRGLADEVDYRPLLEAARAALASGTASFVLTETHYVEQGQHKDARQRKEIAALMAELTDFAALPPRQVLMRHELAASVNAVAVGSAPSPAALALVGRGIAHAAGSEAVFTIGDRKGRWTPDELRRLMSEPMYRDLYEAAERQAQVDVLSGPSPEEAASLRERGWAPEQSRAVAWKRAEQEAEQARRLTQDTTEPWRKGRLRDVVAAEELVVEVLSPLNEMFADGAATLETLTGGTAEGVRRLTRSMPTFEAAVGFKTQYHRNAAHTWTANDVLDIDALAIALPYCDVVFTDKAARAAATSDGLDAHFGTSLPRTPDELVQLLAGLPA